MVEAFKKPQPDKSKQPENFVDKYFTSDKEDVATFSAQVAFWDDAAKISKLQEYLLGAVRDISVVGKYSNFHGAATYTLGYDNPETIRLAYMYGICRHSSFIILTFCYFRFCFCLDGLKAGMAVKEEVLKRDSKNYQKRSPEWKETEEERSQFHASRQNEKHLRRPERLGRFIMDELYDQAKEEKDVWLAKIKSRFEAIRCNVDEDLVNPWDRAMKKSKRFATEEKSNWMKCELEEIAKHVRSVYEDHRISFSPKKASSVKASSSLKSIVPFTELPIEARQDVIRKLSREFVSFPPPGKFLLEDEEIARLRASYAYKYDFERQFGLAGGTSFPWDVAMRELGAIKARATGGHKTVVGEFYDHFNMKGPRT